MERLVNVGDRVEVGQVIARLDDTDLKLTENAAKAALNAARTRRDVASINLDRAKPLLPQGFISKAAFDIRRNEMDAAASATRDGRVAVAPGHERRRLCDAQGRCSRHRDLGDGRTGSSSECWPAYHHAGQRRRDRDRHFRTRAGGRPPIRRPACRRQALGGISGHRRGSHSRDRRSGRRSLAHLRRPRRCQGTAPIDAARDDRLGCNPDRRRHAHWWCRSRR